MRNRKINSRAVAGFTMVEIALALAIIGIGLLAVIGMIPALLATSRSAVDNTEVALAVQQEMEYDFIPLSAANMTNLISDLDWITNTSNKSFPYISKITYENSDDPLAGGQFQDSDGNVLLKTERITYSWPPNSIKKQSFTFVTERVATQEISIP
jgi:prepilin-type N-terminal cleavage/methylation domain-containing protein